MTSKQIKVNKQKQQQAEIKMRGAETKWQWLGHVLRGAAGDGFPGLGGPFLYQEAPEVFFRAQCGSVPPPSYCGNDMYLN